MMKTDAVMADDTMIKTEEVSKKYSKSLKQSMLYGITDIGKNILGLYSHPERLRKGEFWSVKNVSFEIKKGETVGLIGPNGSGKTTLLKMLNGIFWPDEGKITVRGRMGALISVGAGFHPLLSGRDNIYINGAILGMSKEEIDEKLESIIEFADIGDFLDTPVKHYSSGMFVRLGFAVAVHCDPDIMLIDEVLAVGDTEFQSKCFRKIAEFMEKGVAIVLVSHSMEIVRNVCRKALFLWKGELRETGECNTVVLDYMKLLQQEQMRKEILQKQHRARRVLQSPTGREGRIRSIEFFDGRGAMTKSFTTGDPMTVRLEYEAFRKITNPIFTVCFYMNEALYASFISEGSGLAVDKVWGRGAAELHLQHLHLPAGVYSVSGVFSRNVEFNHIDWHHQEHFIQVNKRENQLGLVALPSQWNIVEESRLL